MIIPSGYSQVNLIWSGEDLPFGAETTFGVVNSIAETPTQIAQDVEAAIAASNLMVYFPSTVRIDAIRVKNGPNATGPFAELNTTLVGESGDNQEPPNVAVLVRKNTLLGGRKGSGRWYLPAPPDGVVTADGTLLGSYASELDVELTAVLTSLSTASHVVVLLHSDSTTPTPLVSIDVQTKVATQRRRLRR